MGINHWVKGAYKGQGEATGLQLQKPPETRNPKFKNNTFVDTTIAKV